MSELARAAAYFDEAAGKMDQAAGVTGVGSERVEELLDRSGVFQDAVSGLIGEFTSMQTTNTELGGVAEESRILAEVATSAVQQATAGVGSGELAGRTAAFRDGAHEGSYLPPAEELIGGILLALAQVERQIDGLGDLYAGEAERLQQRQGEAASIAQDCEAAARAALNVPGV